MGGDRLFYESKIVVLKQDQDSFNRNTKENNLKINTLWTMIKHF